MMQIILNVKRVTTCDVPFDMLESHEVAGIQIPASATHNTNAYDFFFIIEFKFIVMKM